MGARSRLLAQLSYVMSVVLVLCRDNGLIRGVSMHLLTKQYQYTPGADSNTDWGKRPRVDTLVLGIARMCAIP